MEAIGESWAAENFNPFVEPHRENPFAFFSWARDHAPLTYVPTLGAWMVARYDDVVRVLEDTEVYSSRNALLTLDRDNPPEVLEILSRTVPVTPSVVQYDPPHHARIRAVWRRLLRGTRINALQPWMYEIAEELVDEFADDGHADLVRQYTRPHILRTACAVIGIPEGDHDRVADGDLSYLTLLVPTADIETKMRAAEEYVEFDSYLLDLLEQRRSNPAGDALTELAALIDDPDEPLSVADALVTLRSMIAAGTHTPADTVSTALLHTLSNREYWERMLADPSIVPAVVEETLRRDAAHRGLMRITTRDTELCGVHLPAGSVVYPMLGSANRDGDHFKDPDVFSPDRDSLRTHLAFGRGPHDCVGAHLARVHCRIGLDVLTRRLPDLCLAPDFVPAHRPDWFFWGLASLDVVPAA